MAPFLILISTLLITFLVLQAASSSYNTSSSSSLQQFLHCLANHHSSSGLKNTIYTANNNSFLTILHTLTYNHRFSAPTAPKPLAIVAARNESHVQGTILCAKEHGIQIRIRSGGHDCEGLSYVSDVPFIILDMFPFDSVLVDIANQTAWVQSGATLGALYYKIAKHTNLHAFPAGVCPNVGAGGHFSGGGYGNLMRKHGLSVDNIVDAKLVDVNGRIHDRKSMGEDLFWAIRGGGGASFGVILSWKIRLVPVTPRVTVFRVKRDIEKGATDVVYKWQMISAKLHEDVFIRAMFDVVNRTNNSNKTTVEVTFIGMFLGQTEGLMSLLNQSFPELGLVQSDCNEMPWINSTLYWYNYPTGTPIQTLVNAPKGPEQYYFKTMSDYVKKPIPKESLESIWDVMIKIERVRMEWNPYGGKMHEIPASETPFPHRSGNLFMIEYLTSWGEYGVNAVYLNISRFFYEYMAPYVSHAPREAFLNYRDVNIGANYPSNETRVVTAQSYGRKYFGGNLERLVYVKSKVDPDNFFRYEQSIPPLLR
ncbi:hypothetical protein PIB30_026555 [Stylosanthes scabra]|uniref:FAD-binding PCMH-type domain-containing protein n=1 Tax=Stylosanthes scabra TaxID=79078 RepID=A0ABU6SAC4_9FABA|nr:hypothetical protein [Stylosanthes scabra]